MIICYEDLQFWSVTTARDPFVSAFIKAKAIYESGSTPVIIWHDTKFIEVKRVDDPDEVRPEPEFKKFKQRTKKKVAKKKVKKT